MSWTPLILLLLSMIRFCSPFPENLKPISNYDDVPRRVFTVRDVNNTASLYVQILKELNLGGKRRIAVAGREKLFLVNANDFIPGSSDIPVMHQEVLSWQSSQEAYDLCLMKGLPKTLCFNFISILQLIDDEKLFVCGTYSYSPMCATYEVSLNNDEVVLTQDGVSTSGKHKSPFGPDQAGASLYTDGSLFSATFQSIFGGSPVITRTMGEPYPLRTVTSFSMMRDPEFIKISEDVRRVLLFFNENEILPTGEKRIISQVAQVCKNDRGGEKILERMFTTFIKARLNCSYNGFYLDEVRDVTDPVIIDGQSVIFATFATPKNSLPGSAVCGFSLSDIHSSFAGPFFKTESSWGSSNSQKSPPPASRHPGICGDEKFTVSDLVYIKSHPQMEKQVRGSLLLTNQGKRWTAINTDVRAGYDNATVLYIGTEDGQLLRALLPSSGSAILLSEQNVFDEARCSSSNSDEKNFFNERRIETILIDDDIILVGFLHCVVSVPLRMCSKHRCQSSCSQSSDPYCDWNGSSCVPYTRSNRRSSRDLLEKSRFSNEPCADESNQDSDDKNIKDEMLVLTTPQQNTNEVTWNDESVVIAQQEQRGEYSIEILLIACGSTFALTLILTVILLVFCRYCCCEHRDSVEDFGSKQKETQHQLARDVGGRRNAFPRKARRRRYCWWKFWICKIKTPAQSPAAVARDLRKHNVYSEPPTRKDADLEGESFIKKSSRMNSVASSITSRQDFIHDGYHARNHVLRTESEKPVTDVTLPKHISEQSTLPHAIKPTCDCTSSSDSRSSGGSPPCSASENVEQKSVAIPIHSEKTRRRNETVDAKTSEIMRESTSAILGFENSMLQLQQLHDSGLLDVAPQQKPHPGHLLPRHRLESHDSGKGESCRNSLWTNDAELSCASSKQQRPSSLNFQQSKLSNRKRLHSEGSYEPNGALVCHPSGRERRHSGNNSNSSNPGTPVGKYHVLQLAQPGSISVPYGNVMMDQKTLSYMQHHPQLKTQRSFPVTGTPTKVVHFHPPPNQIAAMHVPDGLNNNQSQHFPLNNHYASLQVRGAHAQKSNIPYSSQHQQRKSYSPPYNYYPSLPLHSSAQVNKTAMSYESVGSIDRQAIARRKEQGLTSLSRHTSLPPSARPVGFVVPIIPSTTAT